MTHISDAGGDTSREQPADSTSEPDEDGSTGSDPQQRVAEKQQRPLGTRLARLFRPFNHANLRDDLADALSVKTGGSLDFSPEERAMLHNILRLRELRVEDVMVPRAEIEAVDMSTPIGDVMVMFDESGRSRMPVYSENLDDPRGMIHIRDLLAHVTKQARNKRRSRNGNGNGNGHDEANGQTAGRKVKPFDLGRVDLAKTVHEAGLVRKVLFVPPSMLASDLMQRMQATRTQMALVIDEYGGTDGLVSLEDIVEMVVGDIEDEHDDEELMITRVSEDVMIADARTELEELAEAIGPDFDVSDKIEDADTIGGLVFAELGRVPARGEVVQALPGFEVHVLDADPRRIKRVRIVRKRPQSRRRAVKAENPSPAQQPRRDQSGS